MYSSTDCGSHRGVCPEERSFRIALADAGPDAPEPELVARGIDILCDEVRRAMDEG